MSGCIPHLASLHSPVFLLNSCLDLFSAPHAAFPREGPLSLSYGASLPSSLTVNLSSALVYSTRPPVSVYGTGPDVLSQTSRIFSGACSSTISLRACTSCTVGARPVRFLRTVLPTSLQRTIPSVRRRVASPSPLVLIRPGLRNINRMSIHACPEG